MKKLHYLGLIHTRNEYQTIQLSSCSLSSVIFIKETLTMSNTQSIDLNTMSDEDLAALFQRGREANEILINRGSFLSIAADYIDQRDIRDYIKEFMPDMMGDALECMVSDLLSNMYYSPEYGFNGEDIKKALNERLESLDLDEDEMSMS